MKRIKERLDADGELERYCPHCQEWWPATLEFFHTAGKGRGLSSWCRACRLEDFKKRTYKKDPIRSHEYYIANKERIIKRQNIYRRRRRAKDFDYAEHQRELNRKSHNRGICQNCGSPCYFTAQLCRPCYVSIVLKSRYNPTFQNSILHRKEFVNSYYR